MDALALLCNLHADGPLAVRRLQRAGYHSIDHLRSIPPEELAKILDVSPSFAQRFTMEARYLAERAEGTLLEGTEVEEAAAFGPGTVQPATTRGTMSGTWGLDPALRRSPAFSTTPVAPAVTPMTTSAVESTTPVVPTTFGPVVPTTFGAATGTTLSPGLIDGLDAMWVESLRCEGVTTVEALAESPGLDMARRMGKPLSLLMDLQCLAQRFLTVAINPQVRADPSLEQFELPHLRVAPSVPRQPALSRFEQPTLPRTTSPIAFPHSSEARKPTAGGPFV